MPQLTVVITEPINEAGVQLLQSKGINVVHLPTGSNESTLLKVAPEADGIITRGSVKITREAMEANPRLRVIGVHGIGCDHIDLNAARELGRAVCNTPDILSVTVAEMTVGLLLCMTRRIASSDKAIRNGEWGRKYKDLIGSELMGKTVGLVGLGRIGVETARRLRGFGVKLLYYSRTRKPEIENELGLKWVDFRYLLENSDIISLHLPGTSDTHHLIGFNEFTQMKKGVMIVNTARGRIIDESALIEALKSGKVAAAALDVFEQEPIKLDNPLLKMDNVVLAPHLSASSLEAMRRMAIEVAQCVIDVLDGREPANKVT